MDTKEMVCHFSDNMADKTIPFRKSDKLKFE